MKYTLSILTFFVCLVAQSQVKEGAKILDLSFSTGSTDGNDRIFLQPLVGFGIQENTAFYAGFAYSSQQVDVGVGENTTNLFSLIIGYEKFFEMNERIYFAPFVSGSYGFGKTESFGQETDLSNLSLVFRPRLHYFITNKWSVVASVGSVQLSRQTREGDFGDVTNNSFSADLNASNVFFGIRLNLNND